MTAVKTLLGLWNSLTHACGFLNFQIQWMNVETVCTAVWIGKCMHCGMDWELCAMQYGLETVCNAVWIGNCVQCSMDWKLCAMQYGLGTVCNAVWIGNCMHCSMDWELCAMQYGLETVCPAVWIGNCALQYGLETVCTAVWIGNCVQCSMDWKLCALQYGLETVPCSMDWKLCALQYGLETVCSAVLLTVNLCMNCFLKSVTSNIFSCACVCLPSSVPCSASQYFMRISRWTRTCPLPAHVHLIESILWNTNLVENTTDLPSKTESDNSLPCSQKHAIWSHPEQNKFAAHNLKPDSMTSTFSSSRRSSAQIFKQMLFCKHVSPPHRSGI